jgi:hypothetical protein
MIIRSLLFFLLTCLPAVAETIRIPRDHFLGISRPCPTFSLARESAFHEVAKQILRTIGGTYSIDFESSMTQNGDSSNLYTDEQFRYSASGFLFEIERNIASETYEQTINGIIYEMLVHFPALKIERMRRLSLGAKVLVTNIGGGIFELREVNRVGVVLTDIEITIIEQNRHAGIVTLFVMKVSSGDTQTVKKPLRVPVVLKSGAVRQVNLPVPTESNPFSDAILGTNRTIRMVLIGTDEVGRMVRVDAGD